MENKNEKLGYICEYYKDKEIKEWVTREDLNSDDPDKKDLVQGFVVGLMEPWSASAECFDIRRNVRYDGTKVAESEAWKATYTSVFYDTLESVIVAYGATPDEALKNAEKILDEVEVVYAKRYADDEEEGDSYVE